MFYCDFECQTPVSLYMSKCVVHNDLPHTEPPTILCFTGNTSKLYNPDPIDFVIIPHEEYSQEMACDAVMCATDILERVKEFVDLRE